ncbi:MAG: DNA adenine methylase [Dehalococcoidia bacterium]|nr:DNA adenine methylase [Dehalococcoidia bacterium]
MEGQVRARPFLKWAGGKAQLLAHLQPFFPTTYRRYIEPFLGGGAVFFHLQPAEALLSDSNESLVEVFRVVQRQVSHLIEALDRHQPHAADRAYYYELRAADPSDMSEVERAARFIFLNKTCYNGLYRVNRKGRFNVPFGRYKYPPLVYNLENLRATAAVVAGATLLVADFAETMDQARKGDLIYLDPPYDPLSPTANFTGYTATSFGRGEQERLMQAFKAATERGALVILNNSDTEFIRSLYRDFAMVLAPVAGLRRAINSNPAKRNGVTELVITNFATGFSQRPAGR